MTIYIVLVGAAGAIIFSVLFALMLLKGNSVKIPFIGMAAFVILMAAGVVLTVMGGKEDKPDTADQSSQAVESEAVETDTPAPETEGQEEEDAPPQTEGPTESLDGNTISESGEPYVITYQNSKIYKNSFDEIDCYVLVEIENTGNDNLYLKDATFDFEDENGGLLGTCSGIVSSDPDIIAPGERGYFYCNMGSVRGNIDEKTNYVFKPTLKVEKAKNDIVRFDISDLSITEGRYGPVDVIGRITNNTSEDEGLVWISCVLYRADGTPIGVYGTNITDFGAGQTTTFDAGASFLSRLDIKLSDVATYKVYACKTQYQF